MALVFFFRIRQPTKSTPGQSSAASNLNQRQPATTTYIFCSPPPRGLLAATQTDTSLTTSTRFPSLEGDRTESEDYLLAAFIGMTEVAPHPSQTLHYRSKKTNGARNSDAICLSSVSLSSFVEISLSTDWILALIQI